MIYEGSSNIISQPVITFPSDQLTSLEATVVNNYIVILAGTADGKIKKVVELFDYSKRKLLRWSLIFDYIFLNFLDQYSTNEEKSFSI